MNSSGMIGKNHLANSSAEVCALMRLRQFCHASLYVTVLVVIVLVTKKIVPEVVGQMCAFVERFCYPFDTAKL